MTTNQCPLIHGCVRQLKLQLHVHRGLDPDIDIEDLEMAARRVNYTPEYVRLRGFFLIESMIDFIRPRYNTFKMIEVSPELNLQLVEKTWSDLTRVKDALEKLCRECELELAEYTLDNCSVEEEFTVIQFKGNDDRKANRQYKDATRIRLAKELIRMSAVTVKAIRAFRPYLRNEEATLECVSSGMAHVLCEVYGPGAGSHLSTFIHKLIEMRM